VSPCSVAALRRRRPTRSSAIFTAAASVGRSVGRDDRSSLFVEGLCPNLVSRIWSWYKSRPGRFRSVSVVCRKLRELLRIDAPGGLPSATRAASATTSPSSSEHQRCYSRDTRLVSKPAVWSASWSCLEGQVFVFVSVSRTNVWDQSQGQVCGYGFRSAGKSFAISVGLEDKVSVWGLGNGLNGSSRSQSSSRRRSLV